MEKPHFGIGTGIRSGNLAILPQKLVFVFLLFCQRNPEPCPVLEVTESGNPLLSQIARGADVITDISRYHIYQKGKYVAEVEEIRERWRQDLVAFLIGCSYTFETAPINAHIYLRHVQDSTNVVIYITSIPCQPAGVFSGPMVVSMRPIPQELVVRASRSPPAFRLPMTLPYWRTWN